MRFWATLPFPQCFVLFLYQLINSYPVKVCVQFTLQALHFPNLLPFISSTTDFSAIFIKRLLFLHRTNQHCLSSCPQSLLFPKELSRHLLLQNVPTSSWSSSWQGKWGEVILKSLVVLQRAAPLWSWKGDFDIQRFGFMKTKTLLNQTSTNKTL